MKRVFFIMIIILFLCSLSYSGPDSDTGRKIFPVSLEIGPDIPEQPLNTAQSFSDVVPQSTYVFMVGNNHYSRDSGYENLSYSINDVTLLKHIFVRCCKVQPEKIFTHIDIIKTEFLSHFIDFLGKIDKKSLVILFFSGHGDVDGSLVCTNGEKVTPRELRALVNGFPNDTVLIIDACYSGENEGINNDVPDNIPAFKENSIRIYSSLAHQPSKEFNYMDNPFFEQTRIFFRDVLHVEEIRGNGYFTALIGDFFAHTPFAARGNVSFYTLVLSLSEKGKEHLEYMEKNRGLSDLEYMLRAELRKEHQIPKIKPMETELVFNNEEHMNMLLKKPFRYYKPDKNFFSLTLNSSLCLPLDSDVLKNTFLPMGAVNYNVNVKNIGIFGCGLLTGFFRLNNVDDNGMDYQIIPLAFNIKYISNFKIPLFLLADISSGIGFFKYLPAEENEDIYPGFQYGFYISAGCGVGFNPIKKLGLTVSCYVHYTSGIVSFSPGIQGIWSF